MALLHDELVDEIVLLAEVAQGIADFFLLFVTSLPGWDEIVGLKQRASLYVGSTDVEAVLVEHDGLGDDLLLFSSLLIEGTGLDRMGAGRGVGETYTFLSSVFLLHGE